MGPEIKNFFALEGLDGVGKSTVIKELQMGGIVVFKTPPEEIASVRKVFDTQSTRVRFLYYLLGVVVVGDKAQGVAAHEKVFCDRYLLTTVAAHEAMGLDKPFLALMTPVIFKIPRPEQTILLTATEETRMERLLSRPGKANETDIANLRINSQLLVGYETWARRLGHSLVEVDTTHICPEEVAGIVMNIARKGNSGVN